MENKGVYKFYTELPTWAKGIVGVAVIGGIGLIGFMAYKKLSKTDAEKDAEESLKDTNKDLKNLTKYQKPSYLPSQYGAFGDSLYEAMNGMGSDENEIYDVFRKMKNTMDVLLLIQAFGIRDYTDDRVFVFNVKPMNLNQWISVELKTSEKEELNKILSSKGIKFQF
ncbi:MAG: hypothetical protein IPJ01_11935 [Micavibrio sp.]|nr:hypothetical protein [Micavibrio sp.]